MNTPAHILMGVALFARKDVKHSGPAAAFGSVLPDLSLYILAGVSLFVLNIPAQRVFGELYFSPECQAVFAVDNSFILWGAVLLGALLWNRRLAIAFASAGLLHLAFDFPLHHDDARRHFWPISDCVFESPFSYWDSAHHAGLVAPFGLFLVLISAIVIWRRWQSWPVRVAVLLGCLAEIWVVRQWLLFF